MLHKQKFAGFNFWRVAAKAVVGFSLWKGSRFLLMFLRNKHFRAPLKSEKVVVCPLLSKHAQGRPVRTRGVWSTLCHNSHSYTSIFDQLLALTFLFSSGRSGNGSFPSPQWITPPSCLAIFTKFLTLSQKPLEHYVMGIKLYKLWCECFIWLSIKFTHLTVQVYQQS